MRGCVIPLALLLATPATAGPYDVLNIRDSLIGVAPDQIVVLRQSVDNLAAYDAEMVSKAVILIDRQTGAETVFPIARVRFYVDLDNPQGVVATHQIARGDEFALMAQAGARPLGWSANAQELGVTDNGTAISLTDQPDAAPIPKEVAVQHVNASLSHFTRVMDYPRNGPVSFRDMLEGQAFSPDECTARSATRVASPDDATSATLITMECDQPDQHSARVIQLLPAQP